MELVKNNPYRIVGLLVGATAKEQERQIRRLKQFIEAEQDPQDDYSFPTLGNLNRTIENVNDAAAKLNLDSDKMNAALFWFYKGNAITDEPAFDAIKEGDLDQVINIWSKLITTSDVTHRNASAYSNLSTLHLSGILEGTNTNEAILEKGISLKLKFLESDFITDFKALATDETFKVTKKELQLLFLNHIQSEIEKNGSLTSSKLLDILTKQEFSAKEDFLKGFIQKPIEQIEKKIEEAKIKRKDDKSNAANIGKDLFEQTSENLKQLKSILGISNLKYSSISDRVSDEILQCGIDYFSHYKDSTTDPGSKSMDLFSKAKTLAIGNIAKQRHQENTNNLQEWIDNKPERDKQKLIGDDLQFITSKLERFQKQSDNLANVKELIENCNPKLLNIKSVLGTMDNLYLKISTAVVNNAQGMIISIVNEAIEARSNYVEYTNEPYRYLTSRNNSFKLNLSSIPIEYSIEKLKGVITSAWELTQKLGKFDMLPNQRENYNKNVTSLSNICSQLKINTTAGGASGCYIATMAYGDYEHPQVKILRKYRDNVLDKSEFGKWFIKTYYYYSPKMAEKLKSKKTVNNIIRKSLNQFIKLIK